MKKIAVFFTMILSIIVAAVLILPCGLRGQDRQGEGTPAGKAGASLYSMYCAGCHPNGGNRIAPTLPVHGSAVLKDFNGFVGFLRNPTMPDGSRGAMPPYPPSRLTENQARELYDYIKAMEGTGSAEAPGATQGYERGPGYGMGPGMMGGYGMGPGMMGGYGPDYGAERNAYESEPCQKFLDDTRALRKELMAKRFEYGEMARSGKTGAETLSALRREIYDLQDKIQRKNPEACPW